MWIPGVKEKSQQALIDMHHKPPIQGGNGRKPPVPVVRLLSALNKKYPEKFALEYAVPTKMGRTSGYPTCYKMDIGSPYLMLSIEVDGTSHQSFKVKERDRKKTALLNSFGWTVLRFSNKEVLNGLPQCIEIIESTISKLKGLTHIS